MASNMKAGARPRYHHAMFNGYFILKSNHKFNFGVAYTILSLNCANFRLIDDTSRFSKWADLISATLHFL